MTDDAKAAEEVLLSALTLDCNCELALFNLGTLLHRYRAVLLMNHYE
jgi:hypothetical protein